MPKKQNLEESEAFARLWQKFLDEYPTEEDCREALIKMAARRGDIRCRNCRGREFQRKYGETVAKCECGALNWLLSETLFFRIRRPMAWWAAIWLMLNSVVVNSGILSRQTGVASSTAQVILKRIAIALELQLQDKALSAPSLTFADIFKRRSRETPAGKHPVYEERRQRTRAAGENFTELEEGIAVQWVEDAEAVAEDKKSPETISQSESVEPADALADSGEANERETELNLGETEKQVYDLLSNEPLQVDLLCERTYLSIGEILAAVMLLEFKGLCYQPYSNCYVRAEAKPKPKPEPANRIPAPSEEVRQSAAYAIGFLKDNFDGVSRKYLQPFLAVTAFHLLESADDKLNALADASSRLGRISYDYIIAYVTPLTVRFAPVSAAPE